MRFWSCVNMKILENEERSSWEFEKQSRGYFCLVCVCVCRSKDTLRRWVYKRPEKDLVFECRSIVVDEILLYFGPTRIFFSFSFFLYTSVAFTLPFLFFKHLFFFQLISFNSRLSNYHCSTSPSLSLFYFHNSLVIERL